MRVFAIMLLLTSQLYSQAPPACGAEIPAGTNLLARMRTTVKSDAAKVGDTVELEVADDVQAGKSVVLSRGTRLSARVVDAAAYRKGEVARLAVRVRAIVCKAGEQPLDAYMSGVPVVRAMAVDPSATGRGAPNEWKTDQAAWKQLGGYELEPIPNVEIKEAGDDTIGTVLLSKKNNIKLDAGTLLKLRTR